MTNARMFAYGMAGVVVTGVLIHVALDLPWWPDVVLAMTCGTLVVLPCDWDPAIRLKEWLNKEKRR